MKPITCRTLVALLLPLWAASTFAQTPSLEYQVKASYLYNFIQFVTWPNDAFSDSGKFNLCVVRAERFGNALDALEQERVDGRPIALHRLTGLEQARATRCHLVFFSGETSEAIATQHGRLTIGETPSFLKQGGIINLIESGGRIRFEINQQAARDAGLQMSSRLLSLAVTRP
jgi:hypothetical protein